MFHLKNSNEYNSTVVTHVKEILKFKKIFKIVPTVKWHL